VFADVGFEKELADLKASPYVALARREQRLKYLQRQKLYTLRSLCKRGQELAALGFTIENMDERLAELEAEAQLGE
jgi:hypothetical protein